MEKSEKGLEELQRKVNEILQTCKAVDNGGIDTLKHLGDMTDVLVTAAKELTSITAVIVTFKTNAGIVQRIGGRGGNTFGDLIELCERAKISICKKEESRGNVLEVDNNGFNQEN